jgi:hypothetical protein
MLIDRTLTTIVILCQIVSNANKSLFEVEEKNDPSLQVILTCNFEVTPNDTMEKTDDYNKIA